MVFNVVKVLGIEPGAELDNVAYDQWIRIKYNDQSLSLFDMDMMVSEDYVGDYVEMRIGAMFTELESDVSGPPTAKGNRFIGKVVEVETDESLITHIVDLGGILVSLSDHTEYPVGSMIKFKARLDVVEVRGSTGGWKSE